jgi:hypothetical protein
VRSFHFLAHFSIDNSAEERGDDKQENGDHVQEVLTLLMLQTRWMPLLSVFISCTSLVCSIISKHKAVLPSPDTLIELFLESSKHDTGKEK